MVILLVGPFLLLPIQAIADEWRAPAIWPQRIGTRGFDRVLRDGLLPEAITNSIVVGILAAFIGVLVAWPAARALSERTSNRIAWFLVLLPLLLPPLVIGEGLRVWFLRLGLTDSIAGLVLAHLVFVVPYCVLILTPGFTTELRNRETAARTLNGDSWQRLRSITLPALTRPLFLALALGFTISWSQYGTSLGVGSGIPMLPLVFVPIVRADPQVAAVLDAIVILPPLLALAVSQRSGVQQHSTPR